MFSKGWLTQISIVSSRGMLVKSEPTSKLAIDNVGSCSHISSTNWNESLTVYSFLVKGFNMGTKNLARLHVRLSKADKIARNGGGWGRGRGMEGGGGGSHLVVVPCNFRT